MKETYTETNTMGSWSTLGSSAEALRGVENEDDKVQVARWRNEAGAEGAVEVGGFTYRIGKGESRR